MKLSNRLIAANFQKLIIYEYDRYGDMSHDTCLYFAIAHGANSLVGIEPIGDFANKTCEVIERGILFFESLAIELLKYNTIVSRNLTLTVLRRYGTIIIRLDHGVLWSSSPFSPAGTPRIPTEFPNRPSVASRNWRRRRRSCR